MKLYQMNSSGNCYKIRLLLSHLQQDYEKVEVNILAGESRTPEFLTMNPNGRVPLLVLDDGTALAESNAMLFYLAEGSHLLPTSRLEKARVLQWMFFEQYSHEPYIATSRFWISLLNQPEEYRDQLIAKQPGGYAALDVMEHHLYQYEYFVGGSYSIADITLYAYTHVAEEGNFSLAGYPAIQAWLQRIESQPDYIPITV